MAAQKRDLIPATNIIPMPSSGHADLPALSSQGAVPVETARQISSVAAKTMADLAIEKAMVAKAQAAHEHLGDLGLSMMTRAARFYEGSAAVLNQPRDDNAQHYLKETQHRLNSVYASQTTELYYDATERLREVASRPVDPDPPQPGFWGKLLK